MNIARRILLVICTLGPALYLVYVTHQMVKLPSEPEWASPAAMFSNYGYAIGFGLLSLPYPKFSSGVLLLLIILGCFLISRRLIFGKKKKRSKV